jgi:hypothetical protein
MNYSVSRSLGYLPNGQLQGKLLSAHEISQAFPGTPPTGPTGYLGPNLWIFDDHLGIHRSTRGHEAHQGR